MLLRVIAVVLFLVSVNCSDLSKELQEYALKYVKVLNAETYADFTNSSAIRVVFFHESFDPRTIESEPEVTDLGDDEAFVNLPAFLPHYEMAADYLKEMYNIPVGLVDCEVTKIEGRCNQARSNNYYMYGFKNGKEVVKLTHRNLIHLNAIIGNILHLNALENLPIINSVEKIESKIMRPSRGKMDVFVAYFMYLGGKTYRSLVEGSYTFPNDFKYVMLTDKHVVQKLIFNDTFNKDDIIKIYLFKCSTTKEGEPCPYTVYKGSTEKENMTAFMRNVVEVKKVVDLPSDGNIDDYKHLQAHRAYFLYDDKSKDTIQDVADAVFAKFPGSFLVYMLDSGKLDIESIIGQPKNSIQVPSMAVKYLAEEKMHFLTKYLNGVDAVKFIQKKVDEIFMEHKKRTMNPEADTVMISDDEVASPLIHLNKLPQSQVNISLIEALTDKTFKVKTERDTPTLVLFYTKYDHVGLAFLRSLVYAAKPLADSQEMTSLTRVNCFDWTDVCSTQNITKFPTIIVYQKDVKPRVYKGLLDGETVISYRRAIQLGSPIELTCPKKAEAMINGKYPGMENLKIDGTLIGGLSEEDVAGFREVAGFFQGEMIFAYGTKEISDIICENKGIRCLILLTPNRPKQYYMLMRNAPPISVTFRNEIAPMLYSPMQGNLLELTVANFPKFYRQKSPLVVYFGDGGDKEIKDLVEVAYTHKFPNHLYVRVDVSNIDSIGNELLQTYSKEASPPAIAHINFEKGHVHLFDKDTISKETILDWLTRVTTEKQEPTYLMPNTEWKPLQSGYDFMTLAANLAKAEGEFNGRMRTKAQPGDDQRGEDDDDDDNDDDDDDAEEQAVLKSNMSDDMPKSKMSEPEVKKDAPLPTANVAHEEL